MPADVLYLRAQRDRSESVRVREQAELDRLRILAAAERIRRMTRIYQEREDGKRRD